MHCLGSEAYYILPKLVVSLIVGLSGAILFDALVKIPENGGFKISGMTFYGGLIAGFIAMLILLITCKKTSFSVVQWLDILTVPFVLFHFCGRMGCFFAGCCYGKQTDSALGMVFPDQPDAGIFHNGHAVYPTQLFEAIFLFALAIILLCIPKYKFYLYCLGYPIFRFAVEFLRGDDRGMYFGLLSPAQLISTLIFGTTVTYLVVRYALSKKRRTEQ